MTEGGYFPWKVQRILQPFPVANYRHLSRPLPTALPAGTRWHYETTTREWSLQSTTAITSNDGNVKENEEERVKETTVETTAIIEEVHAEEKETIAETESSSASDQPPSSLPQWSVRLAPSQLVRNDLPTATAIGTPDVRGTWGVDYIEHVLLPSDTLAGLCLRYRVTPTQLRQANGLLLSSGGISGSSGLASMHPTLIVPVTAKAMTAAAMQRSGTTGPDTTLSREYQCHALRAQFSSLSTVEAHAYLDMADGNLEQAGLAVQDDLHWERRRPSRTNPVAHVPRSITFGDDDRNVKTTVSAPRGSRPLASRSPSRDDVDAPSSFYQRGEFHTNSNIYDSDDDEEENKIQGNLGQNHGISQCFRLFPILTQPAWEVPWSDEPRPPPLHPIASCLPPASTPNEDVANRRPPNRYLGVVELPPMLTPAPSVSASLMEPLLSLGSPS